MKQGPFILLMLAILMPSVGAAMFAIVRSAADPENDWRKMKPVARAYNPVTDELYGEVYAIEKAHRFPNGSVEEGWLMRPVDVPDSTPMWSGKPRKARVEWRK